MEWFSESRVTDVIVFELVMLDFIFGSEMDGGDERGQFGQYVFIIRLEKVWPLGA